MPAIILFLNDSRQFNILKEKKRFTVTLMVKSARIFWPTQYAMSVISLENIYIEGSGTKELILLQTA